jgi:hypothetical protein
MDFVRFVYLNRYAYIFSEIFYVAALQRSPSRRRTAAVSGPFMWMNPF